MKKAVISSIIVIILLSCSATIAYASINDISIPALVRSIFIYDFNEVTEVPGKSFINGEASGLNLASLTFEPFEVSQGWLYDLAGGGELQVTVGSLEFDDGVLVEKYIDIKGINGEVRLLQNSSSTIEGYQSTLYWSSKKQEGASIVKDFTEAAKCVVLFEKPEGSLLIYGYTNDTEIDFWTLGLPKTDYYFFNGLNTEGY